MKIAILSRNPRLYSTRRLVEAGPREFIQDNEASGTHHGTYLFQRLKIDRSVS